MEDGYVSMKSKVVGDVRNWGMLDLLDFLYIFIFGF